MLIFGEEKPRFPLCYKKESKPHKFCPGCGHGITLKALGFAIDELNIAQKSISHKHCHGGK